MTRVGYWNHNVHYQPIFFRTIPPACGQALDVGCGDGMLACRLAERCAEVTGVDRDARMIALARQRALRRPPGPGRVTFAEADFLTYPLAEASLDFVCANTSLQAGTHLSLAAGCRHRQTWIGLQAVRTGL